MSQATQHRVEETIVSGRGFARTGPDGLLDGANDRGIYSHDLRLIRRVLVHRAERDLEVTGTVAVCEEACAVRFELPDVEPGTGVLLVVELDGTDLFSVREALLVRDHDHDDHADPESQQRGGDPASSGLSLGAARPDARMRLEVNCEGAELVERDGIARSVIAVTADATPRTGSWRWQVPQSQRAPVDVVVELRVAWALTTNDPVAPTRSVRQLEAARRASGDKWHARLPRFEGGDDVEATIARSLEDLEQLRLQTEDGSVLSAGVPWYLTVLGRDALLAAWMALPVDPSLARSTLRHLTRHQAEGYDISTDAEPGKIQHEERRGVTAARWHERYFGAVDATPLLLMLLAETCRWTGDDAIARELEHPARRAVEWILARIEDDELGLVGYRRRAERGLDVQSWKNSPHSQRDHAGRVGQGTVRAVEAQGYAVAALRASAQLAIDTWNDRTAATTWNAAADLLEQRIVDRFMVVPADDRLEDAHDPRRGGMFAQAVDGVAAPLDAWCSNPGHLLWAGAIRDPQLRAQLVAQLDHPALSSGWGIRTMSTLDEGFDPASHHCGSVWPHDTALCVAGIGRSDPATAARIARDLLDAAAGLDGRLPELFSGTARGAGDERPDSIDGACAPQAWAAAAPLLLLRTVLGLEPDAATGELVATVTEAPEWLAGARWCGVRALGARWDVQVATDGAIEVSRSVA